MEDATERVPPSHSNHFSATALALRAGFPYGFPQVSRLHPSLPDFMEILTAVICDSAADYSGKLCLLGTFDTIFAHRFPAIHPHCAVALRIVFRPIDEGTHRFRIAFIDSDGH